MTLVVEDGTGLTAANGYVLTSTADTYHAARGNVAWTGADAVKAIAIVRASFYLDATYRNRYPGYRAFGRLQGLEWPRVGAFTYIPDNGRSDAFLYGDESREVDFVQGYDYIAPNTVPVEVANATCEAALREFVTPGSLAPDLARDDLLTSLQIGSIKFAYGAGSPTNTIFQAVELALVSLLLPASPYSARAARG